MTEPLHQQRCKIHPAREAMARCPSCGGDFCRECINDHDGRMLCADCIRQVKAAVETPADTEQSGLRLAVYCALCVLGVWSLLYFAGRILLLVPMETHE